MSKLLSNSRLFAGVAVLFAASTAFNAMGGSMNAAGGSRIAPDTIEMKSGPTFPPSPWDDEDDEDGSTKLQASTSR